VTSSWQRLEDDRPFFVGLMLKVTSRASWRCAPRSAGRRPGACDDPVRVRNDASTKWRGAGEVYRLLAPLGYEIGRLFPNHVDFLDYSYDGDHFRMGNYVVVRDERLGGLLAWDGGTSRTDVERTGGYRSVPRPMMSTTQVSRDDDQLIVRPSSNLFPDHVALGALLPYGPDPPHCGENRCPNTLSRTRKLVTPAEPA